MCFIAFVLCGEDKVFLKSKSQAIIIWRIMLFSGCSIYQNTIVLCVLLFTDKNTICNFFSQISVYHTHVTWDVQDWFSIVFSYTQSVLKTIMVKSAMCTVKLRTVVTQDNTHVTLTQDKRCVDLAGWGTTVMREILLQNMRFVIVLSSNINEFSRKDNNFIHS